MYSKGLARETLSQTSCLDAFLERLPAKLMRVSVFLLWSVLHYGAHSLNGLSQEQNGGGRAGSSGSDPPSAPRIRRVYGMWAVSDEVEAGYGFKAANSELFAYRAHYFFHGFMSLCNKLRKKRVYDVEDLQFILLICIATNRLVFMSLIYVAQVASSLYLSNNEIIYPASKQFRTHLRFQADSHISWI